MSGRARNAAVLAAAEQVARAADRGAPSRAGITAVTDLAAGSGTAPGETLVAPEEPEDLLLRLGRRGAEEARQPLLRLLREARDPDTAVRLAEVLVTGYGDDTGLRAFQGELTVLDAVAFRRAWGLYQLVPPPQRSRPEYLERVRHALDRQVRPEHLVALLDLLRGVEPGRELGELAVPQLTDRRWTRAPLLHRRGRVGDFAAECLLAALGEERPAGPLARLRFGRIRRKVRSQVRTVEDWEELMAHGAVWLWR